MESEKKTIIMVVVGVILIAVIVAGVMKMKPQNEGTQDVVANQEENEKFTKKLEDGSKVNVSEELNKTKMYKDLEISNIQFTERNGRSQLIADIKNTGKVKHEVEIVKITIIGENGEEIETMNPILGDVEPGKTIQLNANITADVTNAKDFKIEAKE